MCKGLGHVWGVPQLGRIGKRNGEIYEIDTALQNLRHLWPPVFVAQEVGKGLG